MHTDIKGTVFKQSLGLQREDQTRNSYTDVLTTFCKPPPPPHGPLQPPKWRNAERIITLFVGEKTHLQMLIDLLPNEDTRATTKKKYLFLLLSVQ